MKTLMFRRVKWTWTSALIVLASLATAPALGGSDVIFSGGGFIKDGQGATAKRISFSVNLFASSEGSSPEKAKKSKK